MDKPGFTPCRDFPGYEVSACGRVRSVASNWRGYGARELGTVLTDKGYPSVRMVVDGKRRRATVHRLVAAAYLPPKPPGADQIRHLDGDKENNNADNFAWGDAALNAADRTAHGRAAKITPEKREKMTAGIRRYFAERASHD